MYNSIYIEQNESILLIRPKDKDLGPEQAEVVKDIVKRYMLKGVNGVLIDFSLVEYMSSIFLSAIIEILKELTEQKIKFGLVELNPKILEVLEATRLNNIFKIFASASEGYADFIKSK